MTEFIINAVRERKLGLALHYPFLHAAIVGMNAVRTLEFGAGGSTRVFTNAMMFGGGWHFSISTASRASLVEEYGANHDAWIHTQGLSQEHRDLDTGALDLVLHDGSHAADIVAGDIAWVWPRLRRFGLLLVHDTQHSYVGEEMRKGMYHGLKQARAVYTATTLPFGFGLAIVRKEDGEDPVRPSAAKVDSPHTTELTPGLW